MAQLATTYDAVRIPLGRRDLYYFTQPDHAQRILASSADNYVKGIGQAQARKALGTGLLTSEGQAWASSREALRPLFAKTRGEFHARIVDQESLSFVDQLARGGSATKSLRRVVTAYTLEVLGPTLMGRDLRIYTGLGKAFDSIQSQAVFEMLTLNAIPANNVLPSSRRFTQALAYLDDVVSHLRLAKNINPPHEPSLFDVSMPTSVVGNPRAEERWLRDELVTMLLAGHETTASLLAWAVRAVDRDPRVKDLIRVEAEAALGNEPSTTPSELFGSLPYTTAVIHEVMRLHPPVWLISRTAVLEDLVGGYAVPRGADVLICPYALHRDPRAWEEPDRFLPERFLAPTHNRHRYSYIPFGAGPRNCIGQRLGLTESVVFLARLCRDLDFQVRERRIRNHAMLTLRPSDSMELTVGRRT